MGLDAEDFWQVHWKGNAPAHELVDWVSGLSLSTPGQILDPAVELDLVVLPSPAVKTLF